MYPIFKSFNKRGSAKPNTIDDFEFVSICSRKGINNGPAQWPAE